MLSVVSPMNIPVTLQQGGMDDLRSGEYKYLVAVRIFCLIPARADTRGGSVGRSRNICH